MYVLSQLVLHWLMALLAVQNTCTAGPIAIESGQHLAAISGSVESVALNELPLIASHVEDAVVDARTERAATCKHTPFCAIVADVGCVQHVRSLQQIELMLEVSLSMHVSAPCASSCIWLTYRI